jgi:hypothetical protein
MRAVEKALLREAELCAKSRRRSRIVGDDIHNVAEGSANVPVNGPAAGLREREVAKGQAGNHTGRLPAAVETATFTLPWRDASQKAYRRIF